MKKRVLSGIFIVVSICCLLGLIGTVISPTVTVTPTATEYTHKGIIGDEWWSENVRPVTVTPTTQVSPIEIPTTGSGGRGSYSGPANPTNEFPATPKVEMGACHPSYVGVCLPIVDDLNCEDISEKGFVVSGSDPYELDGNDDGIGCEK